MHDKCTKSPTEPEKHENLETNKILNTVLPPIITTVVSAVTECLNKFIEAIDKREQTNRETSHDENVCAQMWWRGESKDLSQIECIKINIVSKSTFLYE